MQPSTEQLARYARLCLEVALNLLRHQQPRAENLEDVWPWQTKALNDLVTHDDALLVYEDFKTYPPKKAMGACGRPSSRLCDSMLPIHQASELLADKGYQSIHKLHENSQTPKRKPSSGEREKPECIFGGL